ncbi:MAG: ISAs1 family transposase, partial [Bauldia sp.]|nr:ISAs1 family transposase [Bauldia sp.]
PLPEVLLLVVCGTICDCDDYDLIADWGAAHLDFLRRYLPYHHGVPGGRWLTILMNRIDPALFSDCFTSWVRETWPDRPDIVAIDGKTSRRSHDRGAGRAALHLVSAFATHERLVLGQEAVADKSWEQHAIPVLLGRLAESGALNGAVVTIDAIACTPAIAAAIVDHGADYVLAVKANQPSLHREIETFFADAPSAAVEVFVDLDKDHGRLEERRCVISKDVDWLDGPRRYPGEPRFAKLAAVAMVDAKVELHDRCHRQRRYYILSAPLTAQRLAAAVRGHWRIENSLHWVLDVVFKDDLSRLRKGHGAHNMAVVRHFAINIVRAAHDRRSLKTRRKRASWNPDYLASLLNASPR